VPPRIAPDRAERIATRFRDARIAVLGDLMLDRFIWGSVSRISPEAPVPIVLEERRSASLGGAGNVARNLIALGGQASLAAIVGDDPDADDLRRLCREASVPATGLVTAPGRPTTVKTRIVAHHQHVVRLDREEDGEAGASCLDTLAGRAVDLLDGAAALVVSDYDKGSLTPRVLSRVLAAAEARRIPVLVDPKVRHMAHYTPATVVTPNAREAAAAAGVTVRSDADLEKAGRTLLGRLGCPWLLITRGERGMFLLPASGDPVLVPARAREVFDVSGAGDTVVATLALSLAAGATMEEGVILANLAAGVVVGKLGTAALTAAELMGAVADQA
jgi:D-beta-D-heptose 7-phosphate kinase/D-beta-D-heptose 1-phosphate adenosyltransferase